METLFKLLVGHALGDFALQTEFVAKNKARLSGFSGWLWVLSAHALIQGGIVYLITGSLFFGLIETALHWVIDLLKCEDCYGIHLDQILHIMCKVTYLFYISGAL